MTEERAYYLIDKSLTTGLNAAEQAELDRWMVDNEALAGSGVEEDLRTLNADISVGLAALDPQTSSEWERLQSRIASEAGPDAGSATAAPGVVRPLYQRPAFMVAAAAAVVLLAIGTWAFFSPGLVQAPATHELVAEKSAPRQLNLEDGSHVHMNAGSNIVMEEGFGEKHRLLSLEGEAYFDVETDPAHPFIIKAQNSTIEVIGTRFNVDARPGMDLVKLTVEEGKVRFGAKGEDILVTAGQLAVYDSKTGKIRRLEGDVEQELAWRSGRIIFDETPLNAAIAELENAYNIEIDVPAAMLEGNVTLDVNQVSAQEAVASLSRLLIADVRWDGPRAILSEK